MMVLWLSILLSVQTVNARETDPWTIRVNHESNPEHNYTDMASGINAIINSHLRLCVSLSNNVTLYTKCGAILAVDRYFINTIEVEICRQVPLINIRYQDSVYSGILNPILAWLGAHFETLNLAPSFTLIQNDTVIVIGADKIGHFLTIGYQYYQSGESKGVQDGIISESSYLGLGVSGIYSYADLYANMRGFDFWTHLNITHVKCNLTACELIRPFDVHMYFDLYFDESLNPSYIIRSWSKPLSASTLARSYPFTGDKRYHHAINPRLL